MLGVPGFRRVLSLSPPVWSPVSVPLMMDCGKPADGYRLYYITTAFTAFSPVLGQQISIPACARCGLSDGCDFTLISVTGAKLDPAQPADGDSPRHRDWYRPVPTADCRQRCRSGYQEPAGRFAGGNGAFTSFPVAMSLIGTGGDCQSGKCTSGRSCW